MPPAAIAADLDQPLDVHRDLLAEIALDAALLLEHARDLADIVLGEILDPHVGVDPGGGENHVRAMPADAEDVGEPDLDALGARQIDA